MLQFDLVKVKSPEALVKYKDQPDKINEAPPKTVVANLQENWKRTIVLNKDTSNFLSKCKAQKIGRYNSEYDETMKKNIKCFLKKILFNVVININKN